MSAPWVPLILSVGAVSSIVALGPRALRWMIRKRLGDYQRRVNIVDETLPSRVEAPVRVAIVGSGVAGLTSAVTLARRGYDVTLFEANSFLGGKLGSWTVELEPGRSVQVSHGFHAFFPHYTNLNRFLDSLSLREGFESIGDYVILGADGTEVRFADLERTPVLNLLSLLRAGVFEFGDAVRAPGRDFFGVFLEYDQETTFERLDHLSFRDFDRIAEIPPRLKVAFNTFARAFFATDDKLSFAELVKSFHFYYLGQDGGLVYEYPRRDYEPAFLAPLREELERHGAKIRLSTPVERLVRGEKFTLNGEEFERVVMATDVVGARRILGEAEGLTDAERAPFLGLEPGQRYAVLRIWIDKDLRADVPVFVITEGRRLLDSVTTYHRFEEEAQKDVAGRGEFVLELHCYAVPDELVESEVRSILLEELAVFFPELAGFSVKHEVFQLKRDFTAFHVGMYASRPETETGVPGLYCAGDWVKLPYPAMLLECACASGLEAANRILEQDGLRTEPIVSVPLRGVMAGMPAPPARRVLRRSSSEQK